MKRSKQKSEVKKNDKSQKVKKEVISSNNSKNLLLTPIIVAVLIFISSLFSFPDNAELIKMTINSNLLYIITFSCTVLIFIGIFLKENAIVKSVTKYSFLIVTLYCIGISFIPDSEFKKSTINLFNDLRIIQTILIIPGIALGILAFFQNIEINKEKLNAQFDEEAQGNGKTPFYKNIFSKKEIGYTAVWVLLVALTSFNLFYKLDYFDIYSDEAQVVEGATGYYHSGEFRQWDFVKDQVKERNYDRAWPHLWLVAQSYKIFGITPWAGRFISVLFGIFLSIFIYPVSRFFIKNKIVSLLAILPIAFGYDFLLLLRWTRMYAVLFPLFIAVSYVAYRMITESNSLKFINLDKLPKLKPYIDYNYKMLPFFLVLIYFLYFIHYNSLIIILTIPVFSVFSYFFTKEKKYLTIIILGILSISFLLFNPLFLSVLDKFTFFESRNQNIYSNFILGSPFSWRANIIAIVIGSVLLYFSKNKSLIRKYMFIITGTFLTWLFFSYIFNYPTSFRYVSFAVPLSIILTISAWSVSIKTIFNKYVNIFFIVLIISAYLFQFKNIYEKIYVRNSISPASPSIAFQDIVKNSKEKQLIYRHWIPAYYLDDIDTSSEIKTIDINFENALKTMQEYPSGWLTWKSQNVDKINPSLFEYAELYFKKYRGRGIGNTNVELYYFDKDMFKDTTEMLRDKMIPHANLDINRDITFQFSLELKPNTSMSPFFVYNEGDTLISLSQDYSKKQSILVFNDDTIVYDKSGILFDKKHIVTITYDSDNDMVSTYIDSEKHAEQKVELSDRELSKFKINTSFNGDIDNIKIYDFVPNKEEFSVMKDNLDKSNSVSLTVGDKTFKAIFFWHKNYLNEENI